MTSHHCNFTFILLIKLYNYRNDTIVLKLKDVIFRLIFGVFGPWNINTGSKKRFYKINRKKISHDVKSLKHVLDIVKKQLLNLKHCTQLWPFAHALNGRSCTKFYNPTLQFNPFRYFLHMNVFIWKKNPSSLLKFINSWVLELEIFSIEITTRKANEKYPSFQMSIF